ncbi:MAG: FAD-dependent thymidylate synthase [Aristaeellaceae bacterium]
MPEVALHVAMIRHTLSPEETVALGARLCYSRATVDDLTQRVSSRDQSDFVQKIMGMGHDSVLEHASFTFGVEGVSRVLLAQLTRHRLASFSVQSQRYVSYEQGFGYVVPPRIAALGQEAADEYARQMDQMHQWYCQWQERLGAAGESSNEDARFVLPGACETRLMMTMNVRELRHFFSLRMCSRAQWEIRALATQMHRLCMEVAPALFADAGPGCLRGACPEGAKSCGRAADIRKARKDMLAAMADKA